MFKHPETKNLVITPNYTTAGGSQLNISVSGWMNAYVMKLMGFSSLNVGSNSTVKWGNSRLRVAPAAPNPAPCPRDNKIGALKTATNGLAYAAQECRHEQRRRLCVNHSVRQRRQSRRRQLLGKLDRLDGLE